VVYVFEAAWPSPLTARPDGSAQLTFEVELRAWCLPQYVETRKVRSRTVVELCLGATGEEWVSSGKQCTVCINGMAG